ncbi:LPXTG cell wall anchor domain-containing protein [Streptomyces sp. NPDC001796]|uniref:LPXTG cell wall anchor domain-containing protein n=1 Tax=Streptomyces sp. NPDC001796 TaxID=3364609 RepID=UPI003675E018
MKLRRALAAAAATAAIAPLALLSAPAAFASDGTSSPSATVSPSGTSSAGASTSASQSASSSASASTSASASQSASSSASSSASQSTPATPPSQSSEPSDEPTEPAGDCTEQDSHYKSKLSASLIGLPGKIAVGSGWHPFTLKVSNPTSDSVKDVIFYAGVGPNDESAENAFKASQVRLQAKVDGSWVDIEDGGYSAGFLDLNDVAGGQTLNYQLRLNVKANAPVGSGLTIGGGVYFDEQENCIGAGQAGYVIEIVKAGSDTDGTKPQEGGKVPVPTGKPNQSNTHEVTGTLASTGSSSALPTIALVGGVAVVAGGGVVFAVRRRKAGGHAAA